MNYNLIFQKSSGLFVESPSTYSFPSCSLKVNRYHRINVNMYFNYVKHAIFQDSQTDTDKLHVTLIKATLEEQQNIKNDANETEKEPIIKNPYVVLEMDHPAQRFHTIPGTAHKLKRKSKRSNTSAITDFLWRDNTFL